MRNLRFLLTLASILTAMTVAAQYEKYAGVYFAYQAPKEKEIAPPKGYQPFYISHYGRHGSRWMPKDERYTWIANQFADESNLTDFGKEVKERLQPVFENARGNGGKLTPLGAQQHRDLVKRMYKRYKKVFAGDNILVSARSSTSGRCIASMNAFVQQLKQMNPKLHITEETGQQFMYYIAYTSPEEEELERDTIVECRVTGERLAKMLYKDPSQQAEKDKLLSELHTIAASMQDIPLPYSFWDLFTDDEIKAVYEKNNTRMRLVNGIDAFNHNIPARCAASLWRNIVTTADSVIATGTHTATLRFGHDTCLYHLLSLLGLFNGVPNNMDEIVPMAANLQMVFYRNAAGDILVKVLHNERVMTLPDGCRKAGDDILPPYYHWNNVKRYYQHWLDEDELLKRMNAINTFTGSAPSLTKTAGLFGKSTEEFGQTIPAVLVPNGMNFWTPQTQTTEKKCVAPYYYKDSIFQGFRNSHWLVGGCTQDYGSFTLMVENSAGLSFSHDKEVSHPNYYAVVLPDARIAAEMTGTSRAAIFRFTKINNRDNTQKEEPLADNAAAMRFPAKQKANTITVFLTPNSDEQQSTIRIDREHHRIIATNPVHRIYQGWGESAGFAGYYVLEYRDELLDYEISDSLARLTFQLPANGQLLLKAASSFTDAAGAINNLKTEIPNWDFLGVRMQLAETWIAHLRKLNVVFDNEQTETDYKAETNKFYGAFYRASFLPHAFSDVDGRYPAFGGSGEIHQLTASETHYMDYSMWDTYRAVHPLLNILSPKKSGSMMQSLVRMYEQGGWLPIFPCWNSYTAAMIGDHCASVFADAYVKGIRNFDAEKAYEAMRKNAFETPQKAEDYTNGMGRRALTNYLKYGFIPAEDSVVEAFHTEEQVSRTLEYAYDDFCVAQLAQALGKTDDAQKLMKRSENWRNVIDPTTGYANLRHADGSFEKGIDPFKKQKFITEGAPCHYTWYVPQNPKGLIEALGGKAQFVGKLDSMFTEGRYWHGNEPCHQVAYLFNFAAPQLTGQGSECWRTQKWVRHILDTEYIDAAGGLSGNDDAGQMSSWLLFSMMGFYPVCPGTPYYIIGTPMFPQLDIQLENGRVFRITAENVSSKNLYIQSATLNGKPYNKVFLLHSDIAAGGDLHFVMGSTPSTK